MDITPASTLLHPTELAPHADSTKFRPTYLLSGLIKCGCCGATYTLLNKTRYGCSAVRNKGTAICTNRITIRRDAVEQRVLAGLGDVPGRSLIALVNL